MSGDSKIGLQVGGVVRIAPVRRSADSTAAASVATPRAASGPLPAASLIRIAGELAAEGVPVDTGRVAAIRTAIAEGRYAVDPDAIAGAMVDHFRGNTGR